MSESRRHGALVDLRIMRASASAGGMFPIGSSSLRLLNRMLTIAVGAGLVSLAHSPIIFAIGFGMVAAIGFTAVATNVVASAIARSFDERRCLATGIGTSGATGGQLIVVPIVAVLMQSANWRYGFSALAICALALAVAAYVLSPSENNEAGVREASMLSGARALIRAPAFHILFWSFLICGFTTTGVIETHLLPYASFCGFPPLPSASAYGVLSAVNLAGMVLAGYLVDRVHRPLLLASIYLIRAGAPATGP